MTVQDEGCGLYEAVLSAAEVHWLIDQIDALSIPRRTVRAKQRTN